MIKIKNKTKKVYLTVKQGSVLAYSLIILAMMITIVATLSIATTVGKKSASSTDSSVQAYQNADSGAQKALKAIKNSSGKISVAFPTYDSNCDVTSNDVGFGQYKLSFYSDTDATAAAKISTCTSADISSIQSIKSVGTYNNTIRAVQVTMDNSCKIDSYTKLLLHADGSGNSFVDSSTSSIKTIVAHGGVTQSDTQAVFGGKSAYFNGTPDYLTVLHNSDFEFGTEDWTIDAWVYFKSFKRYIDIVEDINYVDSSTRGWSFLVDNNTEFQNWYSGSDYKGVTFNTPLSTGTWYHLAQERSGNFLYFFLDGVLQGSPQNVTGISFTPTAPTPTTLAIGYDDVVFGAYALDGYIDELHISKGVARFPLSGFTPYSSACK